MNAPEPAVALKPADDFESMTGQAGKWRGECIQQFAELEQIIEGLLRDLRATPRHGGKVDVGQPVGAAFKHLRELTGSKGPFAAKGKTISATLAELAPWFEWRAHLTHGKLTVWRGRSGQWLLAFAHRPAADEVVRTFALTWNEAGQLRSLLSKRVDTLAENARSLANSVRKAH